MRSAFTFDPAFRLSLPPNLPPAGFDSTRVSWIRWRAGASGLEKAPVQHGIGRHAPPDGAGTIAQDGEKKSC